ncbi:hypothetical protein EV05_1406 [Prochlorococcus sp. MIT 0601]|nr:hypothetical protein EV05_1406 [Prochlorococcus sp. MIT 0601]
MKKFWPQRELPKGFLTKKPRLACQDSVFSLIGESKINENQEEPFLYSKNKTVLDKYLDCSSLIHWANRRFEEYIFNS